MFLINLLKPPMSIFPLSALTKEKHRHTLTIGNNILSRTFSISAINISIEALPRAAEDMFPLKTCITVSNGAKLFITSHRIFIYDTALSSIEATILKTDMEMHSEEQRE